MVKKCHKKIKNVAKKVVKTVTKFANAIKNAFTFEAGVGVGLGGSLKIAPIKTQVGAYKDYGFGIKNSKSYNYSVTSAAAKAGISKTKQIGTGLDIKHKYDNNFDKQKHDNPFVMPWTVWNCENSEKEIIIGVYQKRYSSEIKNNETLFIGISLDLHYIVGGHISIGFEI